MTMSHLTPEREATIRDLLKRYPAASGHASVRDLLSEIDRLRKRLEEAVAEGNANVLAIAKQRDEFAEFIRLVERSGAYGGCSKYILGEARRVLSGERVDVAPELSEAAEALMREADTETVARLTQERDSARAELAAIATLWRENRFRVNVRDGGVFDLALALDALVDRPQFGPQTPAEVPIFRAEEAALDREILAHLHAELSRVMPVVEAAREWVASVDAYDGLGFNYDAEHEEWGKVRDRHRAAKQALHEAVDALPQAAVAGPVGEREGPPLRVTLRRLTDAEKAQACPYCGHLMGSADSGLCNLFHEHGPSGLTERALPTTEAKS